MPLSARRDTVPAMATFSDTDEFEGAEFNGVSLRNARILESDVSGLVIRGSEVSGLEIDAPWLVYGEPLRINGVDVVPLIEAELDRQFPGRELRKAETPDGLREAYAATERTWAATLERAASMPDGTVDESVDGEWSFAQTLRHLVGATDIWLGLAILRAEQPFHPLGIFGPGAEDGPVDLSVLSTETPTYAEVLEARAGRVAMVRDFLAAATSEQLDEERQDPWGRGRPETVRSCLHVILEEEWEHHRFAVRDLDTIAENGSSS